MKKLVVLFFLSIVVAVNMPCYALDYYQVGTPTLSEIWVDPAQGNNSNTGTSAASALRTITAAWEQIPSGNTMTSTGYRINLMPGAYPCEPGPEADNCLNFFSNRTGTLLFPVIIRAVGGPGTAHIRGGMDISGVSYLYLIDLDLIGGADLPTNNSGNNLLHLAGSDHVLLRGLTLAGPSCANDTCNNLQEVLKVNQTQHLYVEDSTIGGAWHSSVDYMVVQYGHFINSRVHTAGQWCVYVKGGSSYLRFEGNELHGCQLGFSAGQAANLAVMRLPWLHYEAYDIKFVNNVLYDLPGVGLSVAGGYNILFAHNTLYRVGISGDDGYGLVQASRGERNCTATDDIPNPAAVCRSLTGAGGWGPDFVTDSLDIIPNRNVFVYNNIFYNPSPSGTLYSHFVIGGPVTPPAGVRNIAAPARTDDGLVMKGNIIWNGPADQLLGIEEADQGCQASNPTCNADQLRADNEINTITPQLVAPEAGNFRPSSGGNMFAAAAYAIPDFSWSDSPALPTVPQGTLSNAVSPDRDGVIRTSAVPAGAYVSSEGPLAVPAASFIYSYPPIDVPSLSADPEAAKPFAVGPIASGSSLLRLQVGMLPFAGPVDIYAAVQSQQLGPELWLLDSDTGLRPLSQGLVKWKGRWQGPVAASLFGDIDSGMLPGGRYDLYLMVTPPGSLGAYYLWATYFDLP